MTSEIITFLVAGSAAKPYEVEFVKDGSELKVYCNCLAGSHGSYCKHRINLLIGDSSGLADGQPGNFDLIATWLQGTELELFGLTNEISEDMFTFYVLRTLAFDTRRGDFSSSRAAGKSKSTNV